MDYAFTACLSVANTSYEASSPSSTSTALTSRNVRCFHLTGLTRHQSHTSNDLNLITTSAEHEVMWNIYLFIDKTLGPLSSPAMGHWGTWPLGPRLPTVYFLLCRNIFGQMAHPHLPPVGQIGPYLIRPWSRGTAGRLWHFHLVLRLFLYSNTRSVTSVVRWVCLLLLPGRQKSARSTENSVARILCWNNVDSNQVLIQ